MQFPAYEDCRLRKVAKLATGQRVLDIGYAQIPNRHLTNPHRAGYDLERPRMSSGYEQEIVGDAMSLRQVLDGQRFDSVICGEIIEHLERPYDFLRQVPHSIAPGGRLILTTPNPLGFPVIAWELARSRRRFFTEEHVYYFPPRWVVRMLERCGFRVIAVNAVGLWFPSGFVLPCPPTLSYQVIYTAIPC